MDLVSRGFELITIFETKNFAVKKIGNLENLMYYYHKNPKLTLLLLDQDTKKSLLAELKRRVEVLS